MTFQKVQVCYHFCCLQMILIYLSVTKILRNCDNANLELCKVANWLAVNKLSLNLKKTNFVIFRAKTKKLTNILSTNIGNQNIEQVNTTNFLKLNIDQDLSWKHHIKKGIMITARHFLLLKILQTICYALVYPQLTYCNIVQARALPTKLEDIYDSKENRQDCNVFEIYTGNKAHIPFFVFTNNI